ncbi:MAG: hypothetical protein NWP91_02970 [Rickettsiaceae bacterium]|jgi:hypothetical protein|nr:hypothetical protein [Rickettsiaceae bacterium]
MVKNKMSIAKKHYKTTAATLAFMVISLAGCSTYPNKFKCGDARGLGCTMLRDVDAQIDSGKIEEAYAPKKKCRGGKCHENSSISSRELLQEAPKNKAILNHPDEMNIVDDLDNIYF